MFTGIIEEVGEVKRISSISGGKELCIKTNSILSDSKVGDSISVNGVCLTITKILGGEFFTDAVGETLIKTTIGKLSVGDKINLERAVSLNQRLGGHLVQGHVNAVGRISEVVKLGENYSVTVLFPKELDKYIIHEGSIAVDGISLTIAKIVDNKFSVSVIPHTWKETNLSYKRTGDLVNIEVDVIAKYVEKLLGAEKKQNKIISEEYLKQLGY